VAYGTSLEAAALNPSLLATMRDPVSFYLSAGMELQAAKATLQANQQTLFSTDRNRFLPALGAAWRISPDLVLGLKLDEPFLRHAVMPLEYTGRFQGQALDLRTRRVEAQLGWAASPNWAFGASLGLTRVQFSWDNMVRTMVPNPKGGSLGLMESDLHQGGAKSLPSYSFGFRWAANSRWTLGGAYVGPIQGTLPLSAGYGSVPLSYYTLTGTLPPPYGISGQGPGLQAASQVRAGQGGITLPGKATLGVRQRVNQVFTWELDLRYILGSQTRLPGYPTLTPPGSGPVAGSGEGNGFRSGLGMSLMGELNLSKRWVARLGVSLDPALRDDTDVDPLVGGAKSAGLSAGLGCKCFGGEVNLGYQYRQSQNIDTPSLDGAWTSAGYKLNPGSITRVEGMGHLWAVGYKRAF
jgi:long-subunit fatty acid transport protein